MPPADWVNYVRRSFVIGGCTKVFSYTRSLNHHMKSKKIEIRLYVFYSYYCKIIIELYKK